MAQRDPRTRAAVGNLATNEQTTPPSRALMRIHCSSVADLRAEGEEQERKRFSGDLLLVSVWLRGDSHEMEWAQVQCSLIVTMGREKTYLSR
jgi:hypothetical protein